MPLEESRFTDSRILIRVTWLGFEVANRSRSLKVAHLSRRSKHSTCASGSSCSNWSATCVPHMPTSCNFCPTNGIFNFCVQVAIFKAFAYFNVRCVLQKAIELFCWRKGRRMWSSHSDTSLCNVFRLNLFAAMVAGFWLWLTPVKAFWFQSLLGLTAWPFIQFFDFAFPRLWMERLS